MKAITKKDNQARRAAELEEKKVAKAKQSQIPPSASSSKDNNDDEEEEEARPANFNFMGNVYSGSEMRALHTGEPQGKTTTELKQTKEERGISKSLPSEEVYVDGKLIKVIEAEPYWAWDVTGNWRITHNNSTKDSVMTMSIYMSNSPHHTKAGRQLWAAFQFGDSSKFRGTIRLCPNIHGKGKDDTLKEFGEQCFLESGVWPGPSPQRPAKMEFEMARSN